IIINLLQGKFVGWQENLLPKWLQNFFGQVSLEEFVVGGLILVIFHSLLYYFDDLTELDCSGNNPTAIQAQKDNQHNSVALIRL
ncbi:15354_t:CDS:1, partial [Gigaspora margarita]